MPSVSTPRTSQRGSTYLPRATSISLETISHLLNRLQWACNVHSTITEWALVAQINRRRWRRCENLWCIVLLGQRHFSRDKWTSIVADLWRARRCLSLSLRLRLCRQSVMRLLACGMLAVRVFVPFRVHRAQVLCLPARGRESVPIQCKSWCVAPLILIGSGWVLVVDGLRLEVGLVTMCRSGTRLRVLQVQRVAMSLVLGILHGVALFWNQWRWRSALIISSARERGLGAESVLISQAVLVVVVVVVDVEVRSGT